MDQSGQVRRPAIDHASELAVTLAPAHAATLCLANMSCCGRLCLRRSHLRALGRHDGLERPPRGLRREGCCQRYLGGGGESRAGGASHHGPWPPPSCAAGERASNSYGQSVTGLGHPQRTARARLREPKRKGNSNALACNGPKDAPPYSGAQPKTPHKACDTPGRTACSRGL